MSEPGRILLAGHPAARTTWRPALVQQLTAQGHTVVSAASTAEAVDAMQTESADVAILDAELEGARGFMEDGAGGDARLILNAPNFDNRTVIEALRARVYSLVSNATSVTEVRWAVQEALAQTNGNLPPIEVVSAREAWLEVLAPCTLTTEERLLTFLTRLHHDVPEPERDAVNHALRELLTNAVEWGGRLDPQRRVRVTCVRGIRLILYRIADPGPGFRLESLPHAAVNNPAGRPLDHALVREEKKIRPGGFGISLVRGMVDELTYNEAHNEVMFVKYL
jgi:anti-sigma regulatory factor (Ser/Thr protein kinase)/CheY-like chemotaxis protein